MGLLFNKKILTSEDLSVISSCIGKTEFNKDDWQGIILGANTWFNINDIEYIKPIFNKLIENIPAKVTYYRSHIVEYSPGSYTRPHTDVSEWTMLTLLDGEWEGGELMIEEDIIDFPIGNTVGFDGKTFHSVLPLESGKRTVLVTWVYTDEAETWKHY